MAPLDIDCFVCLQSSDMCKCMNIYLVLVLTIQFKLQAEQQRNTLPFTPCKERTIIVHV